MKNEIRSMLRLGTRLDLSGALEYMRAHGSSVLLNWGEDTTLWECSWITGGDRYTGWTNHHPLGSVLICLEHVLDGMSDNEG